MGQDRLEGRVVPKGAMARVPFLQNLPRQTSRIVSTSVQDHSARGHGDVTVSTKLAAEEQCGLFPPASKVFGALTFRQIFDRAESVGGYMNKDKCLHVSVLFRFCRRLSDTLGKDEIMLDPKKVFKSTQDAWISWGDMRATLERYPLDGGGSMNINLKIELNIFERINSIVSGDSDSILGICWATFIFLLIMLSVAAIVSSDIDIASLQGPVMIVFSIDYIVKLICSPFMRYAVHMPEYLVETVVPDPSWIAIPTIGHKTKLQRMLFFVFAPMNLVDLASILPFWVNYIAEDVAGGVQLGFLRALRILRVIRLLKVGNFSDTLQVLGETLRRSVQSLVAMVIWILIISILVGAVLQQFEHDHDYRDQLWSFSHVSTSVYWVTGRLCNMHGSLMEGKHIPQSEVGSALVLFLGICKGCVLLVPVGQIASAFKEANNDFVHAKKITEQVKTEADVPLGTEWVKDHQSPSAELEIYTADDKHLVGIGSFNLPLLEVKDVDCMISVNIDSKAMQRLFFNTHPELLIEVKWTPSEGLRNGTSDKPHGELCIIIHRGDGFVGRSSAQYICRLRIPVRLHRGKDGSQPMEEWQTMPSIGGAPSPEWMETSPVFNVEWETGGGVSKFPKWKKQVAKQQGLLDMLMERQQRIAALEKMVDKL
jgi:voltage-gated potassium channel